MGLRVALMAVLCIGALAPLVAQADVKFAISTHAVLQGKRSGADVFAALGVEKVCRNASFEGTPGKGSRTLDVIPVYRECMAKALAGIPSKLEWGPCGFLLHGAQRLGARPQWRASVDLACPGQYVMEWNVYEDKTQYERGQPLCTTALYSQPGIGTAELTNMRGSPRDITIHWDLSGIKYGVNGSSLFCGPPFGIVRRTASYSGSATLGATQGMGGQHIDLAVRGQ